MVLRRLVVLVLFLFLAVALAGFQQPSSLETTLYESVVYVRDMGKPQTHSDTCAVADAADAGPDQTVAVGTRVQLDGKALSFADCGSDQPSEALYAELGVRGTLAFIRQSCAAPWLDPERIRALLSQPFQLYLE